MKKFAASYTDSLESDCGQLYITKRASWTASNVIPDSINMNMTRRSLVPPVVPKVRSIEVVVALTSKNTLRILNTIKPVTRAFTAMERAKLVIASVFPQSTISKKPSENVSAPSVARKVASRDDKF